jgi:hypothetical protein
MYNVYLASGLSIGNSMQSRSLKPNIILDVNRILQGYFDKVVRAHDAIRGKPKFGSARVQWLAFTPTVQPHELLVYLLPLGSTMVKARSIGVGSPPPGHDGFTALYAGGASAGSEVYDRFSNDAALIANLMFHEFMHNKLNLGDALHTRNGLAAATVSPSSQLTTENINDMAAALDTKRPQWVEGLALISARSAMPDSDPAKGLF